MRKYLLSLVLATTLMLTGCGTKTEPTTQSSTPFTTSTSPNFTLPDGIDLTFARFDIYVELKDIRIPENPEIDIVVSDQSTPPSVFKPFSVGDFDFNNYFLVFAFMGFQYNTGPKIEIEEIRQVQKIIYVIANFDKDGPTYQPLVSSPVQIVQVNKTNMEQFGQITFKLIDQNGNERATTTSTIAEN